MLNLTTTLILAAGDDPGDPSKFIPSGPNFSIFSGLSTVSNLAIGILLAVAFFAGLWNLVRGAGKFKLADKETGRAAKGVGQMIGGVITMILSIAIVPIILLVISVAGTVSDNIK